MNITAQAGVLQLAQPVHADRRTPAGIARTVSTNHPVDDGAVDRVTLVT